VTARAAIGPALVVALTAACTCGQRADEACDDPSLWYAPDGAGGVYWGCTPPEGWTSAPPAGTADTAAAADTDAAGEDDAPLVTIPAENEVDTGWIDTASTGFTGATAATGATGETGLVPVDTGATGDTALLDTVPPDTSLPLLDTAAPPEGEPLPEGQPEPAAEEPIP
jgi:hypothetical protein